MIYIIFFISALFAIIGCGLLFLGRKPLANIEVRINSKPNFGFVLLLFSFVGFFISLAVSIAQLS